MERICAIEFSDDSCFYYTRGKKDLWQIKYEDEKVCEAPLDEKLYTRLKNLNEKPGPFKGKMLSVTKKIFDLVNLNCFFYKRQEDDKPKKNEFKEDFETIYEWLKSIDCLEDLSTYKVLCYLYLSMMSEWHYKGTKLRHFVKLLGIYQVLCGEKSPSEAAHFSNNGNARDLANEIKKEILNH